MTVREQLHQLVDGLDEVEAERVLAVLSALVERVPGQRVARRQPSSLGHGASGRSDLSQRVDELLADGFGR